MSFNYLGIEEVEEVIEYLKEQSDRPTHYNSQLLQACLIRYQEDQYETLIDKAAKLACDIIDIGPFEDDNVLKAVNLISYFLQLNGHDLDSKTEVDELVFNMYKENNKLDMALHHYISTVTVPFDTEED